jgi:hypothetical protein
MRIGWGVFEIMSEKKPRYVVDRGVLVDTKYGDVFIHPQYQTPKQGVGVTAGAVRAADGSIRIILRIEGRRHVYRAEDLLGIGQPYASKPPSVGSFSSPRSDPTRVASYYRVKATGVIGRVMGHYNGYVGLAISAVGVKSFPRNDLEPLTSDEAIAVDPGRESPAVLEQRRPADGSFHRSTVFKGSSSEFDRSWRPSGQAKQRAISE